MIESISMIERISCRYNICNGNVEEVRALCRRLLDEIFLPALARGNKDFDKMSYLLIESLWPINPFIEPNAFVAFTFILASSSATNNNHSLEIGELLGVQINSVSFLSFPLK